MATFLYVVFNLSEGDLFARNGLELSGKIFALTAWAFFILVNSYYSGALTMFMYTPVEPPFR